MYGELKLAKKIADNSPKKYMRIVEPFGDGGTYALYLAKKKPKEHILNIQDPVKFAMMTFLKNQTNEDKRKLKGFDWSATSETFDKVMKITATEGAEFYYKKMFEMSFGNMQKDKTQMMTFDYLQNGQNIKTIIYELPLQKLGLKNVQISNEADPISIIKKYDAPGTFMILLPFSPEHIQAVEALLPLQSSFFFTKKVMDINMLYDFARENKKDMKVSYMASTSIMIADMEVLTNYQTSLQIVEPPSNQTMQSSLPWKKPIKAIQINTKTLKEELMKAYFAAREGLKGKLKA